MLSLSLSLTIAIAVGAPAFVAAQGTPQVDTNATTATSMIFSNPTSGATWGFSEQQIISWSEPGATDPQNISLLLVNVYNPGMLPNYPTPLALNIFANQSAFDLASVSLPAGDGYVVLMTDIYNSSNIYAQGGIFSVSASDSTDSLGSGFSVASTTTIAAGGPAGGEVPTSSASPARMVRHRRSELEKREH